MPPRMILGKYMQATCPKVNEAFDNRPVSPITIFILVTTETMEILTPIEQQFRYYEPGIRMCQENRMAYPPA